MLHHKTQRSMAKTSEYRESQNRSLNREGNNSDFNLVNSSTNINIRKSYNYQKDRSVYDNMTKSV